MAEEKNGRVWVNAFEDWTAQSDASQSQLGEWTVRFWNNEPWQPALAAGTAKRLNRALVFPASQPGWSLAGELASRFGPKPIWQAAGFSPRLPASRTGGFEGDASDETIRMGRTNTMLYL